MPTTTPPSTSTPSFDAVFEQAKDAREQAYAAARKAGNLYLNSYEQAVDRTAEAQLKLADLTQQEWLKSLIEAQVGVTREFAKSYTSAARAILR